METAHTTVRMADMKLVVDGAVLKSVLGSCVGIIIRDPRERISAMAHILLPSRKHDEDIPGKYADSAVPSMLAQLTAHGCRADALQAFLVGGASMFPKGDERIASIGEQNVAAARRALSERAIPIVFEDTGGTSGRSVTFDNYKGQIASQTLRAAPRRGDTP